MRALTPPCPRAGKGALEHVGTVDHDHVAGTLGRGQRRAQRNDHRRRHVDRELASAESRGAEQLDGRLEQPGVLEVDGGDGRDARDRDRRGLDGLPESDLGQDRDLRLVEGGRSEGEAKRDGATHLNIQAFHVSLRVGLGVSGIAMI